MNIYLPGLLWVVGAAVVGALIAYLVRRLGWDEGRAANNDAAGQVFTIVGGLQAVLVAFVLISLFDDANTARQSAAQEANGLVAVTWAVDALPGDAKTQVHDLAVAYANTVAQQEWPALRDGGTVPQTGWQQLDQLRVVIAGVQTGDDWELDRKTEATNQLWTVYQARQDRLDGSDGVGTVLWFALVVGSLISVVLLPNLFGGTRLAAHIIVVSTLAAAMALLLYATYQLQNPYGGGAQVGPDAFTAALPRLG